MVLFSRQLFAQDRPVTTTVHDVIKNQAPVYGPGARATMQNPGGGTRIGDFVMIGTVHPQRMSDRPIGTSKA
jgi:hypothetical protein